ncbi:type II toxin-antitoxin system VapC family toxin [Nakamurella flava]|uniref:Ribonuclease VapC n=1 Tax=Nakamurella flava TaxID=2576308 RepID=A0A4U6Q980_9ACTN|nr:type II toxin-antitoxin system VapC family toxin [Nakamurella flava]TKV56426.1 type II toxin-antitoxin system VapC family toxin [Nakamurella flava]
MIVYIESSAAAKLLVAEAESSALVRHLDHLAQDGGELVAGALLDTELRRLAVRTGLDQTSVSAVLDRIDVVDLDRDVFRAAGLLPGANLRSLDALHVAVALRLDVDAFLTYDERQAQAAHASGLATIAPR